MSIILIILHVLLVPRLSVPHSLNDPQVYSMATVASEHFKPVPRSVEEALGLALNKWDECEKEVTIFIHCLGLWFMMDYAWILLNEVECNELVMDISRGQDPVDTSCIGRATWNDQIFWSQKVRTPINRFRQFYSFTMRFLEVLNFWMIWHLVSGIPIAGY